MKTHHTGLLARVQARVTLGLPVENSEVLELIEIVNHNAHQLTSLGNRIEALEKPKSYQLVELPSKSTTAMQDFCAERDAKLKKH